MSPDPAQLDAIDVHVHIEVDAAGRRSLPEAYLEAAARYFGAHPEAPSIDEIAGYYRERRMAAVVFTVDAEAFLGHPALSNDEIAEGAARHSDVLIPFAGIDPAKGDDGARTFERLITDQGVRGLKLHPSLQNFAPNDRSAYPLLEVAQAHRVPVVFHTGQTGIGSGMPGGGGIRLRLSDPMLIDDVAVDFPDLTIVMAHPSVPWQDAAIAVATHKPGVHIDLSGWSPKYFPPQLVQQANSLLQDKVLFGSDHPLLSPDRWMRAFDKLDIKPGVRPKILKENAVRVLGLHTSR
jgi:uncharacterized protein